VSSLYFKPTGSGFLNLDGTIDFFSKNDISDLGHTVFWTSTPDPDKVGNFFAIHFEHEKWYIQSDRWRNLNSCRCVKD